MDANFERARGKRRWIDRKLMEGEWPVLLRIMGKGEGEQRYLSVAEVRTLFAERRLPERINARLQVASRAGRRPVRKLAKAAIAVIAIIGAAFVAIAEFPDEVGRIVPPLAQLLPPPLPGPRPSTKAAYWLDQNWSTEDRHWFHHASQGTATFPVPYAWFLALEQPGIHLVSRPGLLSDSNYLERIGFLPSPKSIHADAPALRRFGYAPSPDARTEPAPDDVFGLRPTVVENFDGLPVGFARLTGVANPGTGQGEPDRIGLTCAACHTGSIRYKGISVRFDGGPAMVELRKLEIATGLSILYTLKVPGRFGRFAARVLGPDESQSERDKLEADLAAVGDYLLNQKQIYDKTIKAKGQKDTDEGFGRLDALNRIGNQVFYTDLALGGLSGLENNLHADDAPVSFPPIWTVPWFWWAQYDASIEQPLIRNAGEALGVSALINLSPTIRRRRCSARRWRWKIWFASRRCCVAPIRSPANRKALADCHRRNGHRSSSPTIPPGRSGRSGSPRVARSTPRSASSATSDRSMTPPSTRNSPTRVFGLRSNGITTPEERCSIRSRRARPAWERTPRNPRAGVAAGSGARLPKFAAGRGTGRAVEMQGFAEFLLDEMPFSVALMIVVDKVSRKWMKDRDVQEPALTELWGQRSNCPNPLSKLKPQYRARPLNGVWATAPYLHNGSVPSLYWMLRPAAERPKQFCMGARDFDPEQVGFRVDAGEAPKCSNGETLFSTTDADGKAINGNSVLGHSLEGKLGWASSAAC